MHDAAGWPAPEKLPPDFAERERAYDRVMRGRLEVAVLMAERSFGRHDFSTRQMQVRDQVHTIEAHLDMMTEAAYVGSPITRTSIELLSSEMEDLNQIMEDNASDYAVEDLRMADAIEKLEASIASWQRMLS